jgi:hypothetical protein
MEIIKNLLIQIYMYINSLKYMKEYHHSVMANSGKILFEENSQKEHSLSIF